MEFRFKLSAKLLLRRLLIVVSALIALALLKIYTGEYWFFSWLADKFDLDVEGNFPSVYSGIALAFSALLLFIIGHLEKQKRSKYSRSWMILSGVFLFLAIDEMVSIHEFFVLEPVRESMGLSGIFYFTWVLPAIIILAVFVIAFSKFLRSLNRKTRMQFILAGVVFVLGAVGCEMIGGYVAEGYFEAKSTGAAVPRLSVYLYNILVIFEEGMEMLGVVLFIHALITYIQQCHNISELTFQFPEIKQIGHIQKSRDTSEKYFRAKR